MSVMGVLTVCGSEGGEAESLVGVLVDQVRVERCGPVPARGHLDLAEGRALLDQRQDVLVLAHRLGGAPWYEAEGRVAQVPEPAPLGVDKLEHARVRALREQDGMELLVQRRERAR